MKNGQIGWIFFAIRKTLGDEFFGLNLEFFEFFPGYLAIFCQKRKHWLVLGRTLQHMQHKLVEAALLVCKCMVMDMVAMVLTFLLGLQKCGNFLIHFCVPNRFASDLPAPTINWRYPILERNFWSCSLNSCSLVVEHILWLSMLSMFM